MLTNKIVCFKIDGELTQQQIGVYVIIAISKINNNLKFYIGKTGDNRYGCNPIISRIGNHFSFNKIHSQLRNKLPNPLENFEFEIIFTPFFNYSEVEMEKLRESISVINEMERQVNVRMQNLIDSNYNCEILNKYLGKGYISIAEKEKRRSYLTIEREQKLKAFIELIQQKINTEYNNPYSDHS